MEPNVYVESIALLEAWAADYQRFAEQVFEALRAVEHQFRARWESLEHRYRVQQARIAALQERLETAPEDEADAVRARLEEAEARAEEMRSALARLHAQYQAYRHRARALLTLLEERVPKAKAFLMGRAEELRAYVAVTLPGSSGPSPGPRTSESAPSTPTPAETHPAPPAVASSPPPDPTRYALPAGFRWIPTDDIDLDPPSDEAFAKVSPEEVRRGWSQLPGVLEQLQDRLYMTPIDNSLYFHRLDLRAGRSYEAGLQRVYDAFFGSDPIRLERVRGTRRWRVIDGRHRIRVARELGWPVVPAVAEELDGGGGG